MSEKPTATKLEAQEIEAVANELKDLRGHKTLSPFHEEALVDAEAYLRSLAAERDKLRAEVEKYAPVLNDAYDTLSKIARIQSLVDRIAEATNSMQP